MSDKKDNSSDIDLSEDLNIDDLLNDLQLNEQTTEINEDIKIDENINIDEDISSMQDNSLDQNDLISNNEIDELDSDLNIDDDVEIKNELELESTGELDLDSEIDLGNIDNIETENLEDFNINSQDELNINVDENSILDNNETSDNIDFDNIDEVDIENLDLKSDLGLNDKLSISTEEKMNSSENNTDFDLSDDEGNPIGESEEEYGVDIKSRPETISSFEIEEDNIKQKIFPEENEENLRSIVDDIEKEIEIDEINDYKEYNDLSKKSEQDLDPSELSDEVLTQKSSEDHELKIDNLDSDLNIISSDLDEDIPTEMDTEEIPVLSSEDIDFSELSDKEFIEETSDKENEEKNLNIDSFDMDSISEDIESLNSKNNVKQDVSPEELDINLSEDEINSDNLENFEQKEDEFDLSEINIPSSFESEIIDESSDQNDSLDKNESININNGELTDLENEISTEDQSLKELDEEISDIELSEIEGLSEDASTTSSDDVTLISDEIKVDFGSLDQIDLDNIPQPAAIEEENKENESISLSIDELDNVTLNAKAKDGSMNINDQNKKIENEIETFDFDTLDEELRSLESEIKISDTEENIYKGLKQEMIENTDASQTLEADSLKQNIKDVLMYLDQLLDALPEEKIKEFAESKTFEKYKKLFKELNIKT